MKSVKRQNKKVFVGLSGGVDSSVSALLLKQSGYDVVGVYIKGWQPEWVECTWKEERLSAMRTAAYLDIPFLTLDGEDAYKKNVAEYMLKEYARGRTPNGDMLCNREIKFGIFLKFALENGADFVATGHYAQVVDGELQESVDTEKDQTYFLSQLTQVQLQHAIFPIGHLVKSEVRKLAAEHNLPVAGRKDSQGICFVGDMSMEEWLKKELNPKSGNVLDMHGEVVGLHDGAVLYTIGQRHGFTIFNTEENKKVLYVIDKDVEANTITVSESIHEKETSDLITVADMSFTGRTVSIGDVVDLRYRYRGEKLKAVVHGVDTAQNSYVFKIDTSINLAKGQFAVLYSGNVCLGGGTIV
jgi:tRNA-specific 2-thiouridylase